ncbi:DEP domain-containing protein 1A [Frankliniella fusca]|uniref:DEP domain-containing protein 1A n=1 Tax=Frankliniella fusca TaxID=407009 RepID=A0AAE1HY05_9NEOP|nr:DEP domain-containing protein 1A [Frankliniella fusca]
MQRENVTVVPFRATRLWDEAIKLFINGMPVKRHRSNMKVYDNCFTGSEAVKWFLHTLEMNPLFNTVITQEKTVQLLSKFYEEGIFVRAKESSRHGPDRFKLQGIYLMGSNRPQYTARTPLAAKCSSLQNQKRENWIRKSLNRQLISEYENLPPVKRLSGNLIDNHATYQNMPPIKQKLFNSETDKHSNVLYESRVGKQENESIQKRVAQHPIQFLKQYSQLQDQRETQPQTQLFSPPETDDLWRKVFIGRLQSLLKDLDVSGLFWPSAVIRCRWLEQNCCILDDSSLAQLPPWVSAASNRLLLALGDKSLNRSVVNSDIEADVSALEAFFSNLPTSLIPPDLSAIFQRVFLHLELSASSFKGEDALSQHSISISKSRTSSSSKLTEGLKCTLPPNTCYETAFTSESPVTRIVPQSSFDTLHLPSRPASACSKMKRNASAPKLLETTGLGPDLPSIHKRSISSSNNSKFSTIDSRFLKAQSKCDLTGWSLPQNVATITTALSDSKGSRMKHDCGKLTVMDKTPPLPPRHVTRPPPLHRNTSNEKAKHSRSNSGGYINLALQDSFEDAEFSHKELDIEAAMETLQKLMICSKKPSLHTPRKDGTKNMHVRSASLSHAQANGVVNSVGMRRSQSSWSQEISNASLSSYHTAISSSTSSLNSDSSSSNASLNLTAGCEWGWDWGSAAEQTGVDVFRLLLLLVKPQSRAQLQLLLKLMRLLPYQCPYTTLKVMDMFLPFIIQGGDEDVTSRLLGFLVRHQKEIFNPPQELVLEVQQERKAKIKQKVRGPVAFCERVSLLQFEEQKLTTSQKALAELLDQIVADQKMNSKEKNKKLRMFKESYPHIYSMRFPQPEMVTFKRRNKSILQLARLRSLRV